jgi:hypothetical protein
MKAMILVLCVSIVTAGQQRNTTVDVSPPSPGPAGTVTLTLREYDRLVELASRKTTTPDAAPLPFVLSRAVFRLRVENQTVLGTADIEGSLLEKGPVKIPLTSGVAVLDAKQPLPILQEGQNHAAVLNGPGPFAVSLGIASALTIEPGRASFALPVPLTSTASLTLELAGNNANVRVEPGLITSTSSTNGHTTIEAALEPGKPARIWWTTREIAAPLAKREVRFTSDIKTVVSVGDSQLRLTALCDLSVIQGEAGEFKLALPAGFEVAEASGNTLESSEVSADSVTLRVHDPTRRTHQFLIAIERNNRETKVDVPILAFSGAQRETGELLVEGAGAMELNATATGSLRRIDVKEAGAITRSLSQFPLQAAFRYNRRATDAPKLNLEWTQFSDADLLSAVAERATVTTLMNVEGRSLTEVSLRVRNHAKAFMKVDLPAGAQLFSAEIEGESVKPVEGDDGSRVPLLRPGLDSSQAYTVSFVYVSSGASFGKKGKYETGLPKLDIPVSLLAWELFLPERLRVKRFGGNALAAEVFPEMAQNFLLDGGDQDDKDSNIWAARGLSSIGPGQIGGVVVDPNGAVITGATITVTNRQTGSSVSTTSDGEGRWLVSGVQPGAVSVGIYSPGFKQVQQELELYAFLPARIGTTLEVGNTSNVVTVTGDGANLNTSTQQTARSVNQFRVSELNLPSLNVLNLQRRVAGILPVRVDVPRSGKSYRFVRPLVLDGETRVSFQYKLK